MNKIRNFIKVHRHCHRNLIFDRLTSRCFSTRYICCIHLLQSKSRSLDAPAQAGLTSLILQLWTLLICSYMTVPRAGLRFLLASRKPVLAVTLRVQIRSPYCLTATCRHQMCRSSCAKDEALDCHPSRDGNERCTLQSAFCSNL